MCTVGVMYVVRDVSIVVHRMLLRYQAWNIFLFNGRFFTAVVEHEKRGFLSHCVKLVQHEPESSLQESGLDRSSLSDKERRVVLASAVIAQT